MEVDDLVFVGGKASISAFEARSGSSLWTTSLREGFFQQGEPFVSLCLCSGVLIVHTKGTLAGLDPLSGTVLWKKQPEEFGSQICSVISSHSTSQAVVTAAMQKLLSDRARSSSSTDGSSVS